MGSVRLGSRLVAVLIAAVLVGGGGRAFVSAKTFRRHISRTPRIVDYQRHLSPCFKKRLRRRTRYIIIHTSEGGLASTLRTLSRGKFRGCRRTTCGGHANYAIARNGTIYRILDHRYRADHAGLSMWNGERNLSSVSVGIELVGYHYGTITDAQYRSVAWLIRVLERIYHIPDRNVLTHAQVAYAHPNAWFRRNHRGRKKCAKNFDRRRAGLKDRWTYDPDVRAGRLQPDVQLARIFYGPGPVRRDVVESNIISASNSAWNIAGEDYNAPTTLYILPNGKTLYGNEVGRKLGWKRIPAGTRLVLNVEPGQKPDSGPVMTLDHGKTAWSLAGPAYQKHTTFYFFPDGRVLPGNRISDWDSLPLKTRMILGYKGPYILKKGVHPRHVVGWRYRKSDTLYFYPNNRLLAANQIRRWTRLPTGTRIFVKKE